MCQQLCARMACSMPCHYCHICVEAHEQVCQPTTASLASTCLHPTAHPPQALKPGGRLVYSTCSILDLENDQVVDRVLERGGGSLRVLHPPAAAAALEAAGAQRTRHGWLLLPDGPLGCGPIYLAVLDKVGSSSFRRVKQNKYAPK